MRRVAAAMVAAALVPAAAASAATLSVEHSHVTAVDVGPNADGVISPGDQVDVTEAVNSAELQTISGVNASISAPFGGVTIVDGASPFGDLVFGQDATNSTPFRVQVPAGADCGTPLRLSMHLTAGADSADIPFKVPTGVPGKTISGDATDVPSPIPNPGTFVSDLAVNQVGRVKDVRVRIMRLDHTYDQDLRLTLIAPDGTRVLLADGVGGSSDNFLSTTFASQGPSITTGTAPFSGTFKPQGDLSALDGVSMQGNWKLQVDDTIGGDSGTIYAWGLDLVPAACVAQPAAAYSAAPQPVLPGANVTFDASASTDPLGPITHYEWDLDGNGTYETDGGTSPVLIHAFPARGAYPVGLRISDGLGGSDTVTHTISVTTPPVADLAVNPIQPVSGSAVTLDASGSHAGDVGGAIVNYDWDVDNNGSFESSTGASPQLVTSFATPGSHTVRVRVTDDTGTTAVASKSFVVDNRPPTAALTVPTPAIAGVPAQLDASASTDPDGVIDRYRFDLDGNGSFETDNGTTPTISHTYATAGTYNVSVEVRDDSGSTDVKTVPLVVTAAPVAALTATPQSARPRQTITLDASASTDPDGTVADYRFDLDGDGTYETDGGTNPVAQTSFTTLGTHNLGVQVTDNSGATATATVPVAVVDLAPVPLLSVAPSPAIAGQQVILDGGASADPDGQIVRYEWDLDGNGGYERDTQATSSTTYTYPNPGTFQVHLRVTDNDGVTAVVTKTVTVAPAPAPTGPGSGSGSGGGTTTTPGGTTTVPGGSTTPGGGTTTTPGGGSGGGAALPGDTRLNAGLIGDPMQRFKAVTKKGVTVTCVADRPVLCALVAEVQAADAKRLKLTKGGKKAYTIGTAWVSAARGRNAVATIKLPAKLRKALKKQKSLLVVVRGVAVDATKQQLTLTRAVLLRR